MFTLFDWFDVREDPGPVLVILRELVMAGFGGRKAVVVLADDMEAHVGAPGIRNSDKRRLAQAQDSGGIDVDPHGFNNIEVVGLASVRDHTPVGPVGQQLPPADAEYVLVYILGREAQAEKSPTTAPMLVPAT